MKIVAVLETMWGDRPGRAPRFFQINPDNNSGRRLYKLVGEEHQLLVTNACKELVTSANKHGKPDPKWLADNLSRAHKADIILVCGKVAQKTYWQAVELFALCVHSGQRVYHIPHPAARRWTKKRLQEVHRNIFGE